MKILGVDPGLQGALATWDGKKLDVYDVPTVKARGRGNEINLPALRKIISHLNDNPFRAAYIERNSIRPGEGGSSSQKNGIVVGILIGCALMCCENINRPTAQQWKKAMGLSKDKNYSRTKAIELFPYYHELFERKKDHGRAEAALLAYYGRQQRISEVGDFPRTRQERKRKRLSKKELKRLTK